MEKKSTKKNKKSAKSSKTSKKVRTQEQERELEDKLRCEIAGIVWITLGLLLGLSIYFISRSPFGAAVSSFIIGLFGIAGYLVPLICMYVGVLMFMHNKRPPVSYHIPAVVVLFLMLTLINVNALDESKNFWQYIGAGYAETKTSVLRGGFFSSWVAYPLARLATKLGANIILIASMIITLIITFRISIADAINKAREKRKEKNGQPSKTEKSTNNTDSYDDNTDEDGDYSGSYDDLPFDDNEYDYDNNRTLLAGDTAFSGGSIVNEPEEDDYIAPDDDGLSDDAFAAQTVYQRPPITLLTENSASEVSGRDDAERQGKALIAALANFGIEISISHISIGPAVTRFEIQLARGVRIKSITSLNADIALALAAESVRIEAPIPGKQAVGIEIPNKQPSYVLLREMLESSEFRDSSSVLTIAVGKDIIGKNIVADISKMPHLMIAGSTGSGKSVCMNTCILSLIYKSSPEDVRMILIDPKIVEFGIYANLPHLLIPVVTDTKKAASALKWSVGEMSRRYSLFAKHKLRNIGEYNAALPSDETRMPRIVIIIDELAELMMSAAKEVEDYITRIAQLGRACGIHLIVATQRPSVDIITGKIKANIVSRIAFAVSDATNSKVILDTTGAECLIGNGDMLFHPLGMAKPRRVQGAFVSSSEVEAVLNYFTEHNMLPVFDDFVDSQIAAGVTADVNDEDIELDNVFIEAARLVIDSDRASISYIQQKLRLGYNRAARIMNAMETYGVVSTIDPVKKERKVTMTRAEFDARFAHDKTETETEEV